jgi:hypothetical protein
MGINDWVLIFTTIFLGFIALIAPSISELIKRKWFAPKINVNFYESPPACHKTYFGKTEPVYYFRFEVENIGKSQARSCEAVLENLVKADAAGNFPSGKTYTPVNLDWGGFTPQYPHINPRRKIYCNLLSLPSEDYQKSKEDKYVNPPDNKFPLGIIIETKNIFYAQPNRLPPGKYRFDVVIYSENSKEARCSFIVIWSGEWKHDEEDIFNELVIKK